MAIKKLTKEHPLTTFRKANDVRNAMVKKSLPKAEEGISTGPGFADKVKLAVKRVDRNITNRKAVNQLQKSEKFVTTDKPKSNKFYDKAEITYDKAVEKNKDINRFKRKEGFKMNSSDGTYFGTSDFKKPGKIFDIHKKGGVVKSLPKAEYGNTVGDPSIGKKNRLARQEKRVYEKYTDAKTSGNTEKSGKLYDKLMDKQTKSIKAGVNVQYKKGGAIKSKKK